MTYKFSKEGFEAPIPDYYGTIMSTCGNLLTINLDQRYYTMCMTFLELAGTECYIFWHGFVTAHCVFDVKIIPNFDSFICRNCGEKLVVKLQNGPDTVCVCCKGDFAELLL